MQSIYRELCKFEYPLIRRALPSTRRLQRMRPLEHPIPVYPLVRSMRLSSTDALIMMTTQSRYTWKEVNQQSGFCCSRKHGSTVVCIFVKVLQALSTVTVLVRPNSVLLHMEAGASSACLACVRVSGIILRAQRRVCEKAEK